MKPGYRAKGTAVRLGLVSLIAVVWVVSVFAQDPSSPSSATANNQTAMIVTSIVGFLTLLVTQIFSMWKQNQEKKAAEQRRQWDLEDREIARQQMKTSAQKQLQETVQTAVTLADVTEKHHAQTLRELTKNTELTKAVAAKADAAYDAANSYAAKTEELRKELKAKADKIDHIDTVSVDTNLKVTDIKEGKP